MADTVKTVKLRRRFRIREKKLNRSMAGNALLFGLMIVCGVFMVLPLIMVVNNAVKPIDEIFQFPPRIFVRNPTLSNFADLFVLMNDTWVPFSRYLLNTVIITLGGMLGHVIIASLAAYPLAKHDFPGKNLLFSMVVLSMMFSWTVTQIPQYVIISLASPEQHLRRADLARLVVWHGAVPDEAVHGTAARFADGIGAHRGRERVADLLVHHHAKRQARVAHACDLPVPADVGQHRKPVPQERGTETPAVLAVADLGRRRVPRGGRRGGYVHHRGGADRVFPRSASPALWKP